MDPLTGLYNHNFFYKRLEEEFDRASRYGMPLSVVMMDIDNFQEDKRHLRPQGRRHRLENRSPLSLRESVRKSDLIARYGGEEFGLILTYTQKNGAAQDAERIRKLIEGLSLEDQGLDLNVTMSFGVTEYDEERIANAGELIEIADTGPSTGPKIKARTA